MHYMGIDHHKQYSHITVMNERGEVIKAEKVWNIGRALTLIKTDPFMLV